MDDSLCVFFHSTAPMRYSKNHSSRVEFTLNANYTHKSTIKFQTSIIVLSSHCNVKIFSFADSSLSSLIQLFIGCEWIEWRERDWGTERESEWMSLELISKIETISEYFELFLKGMECVKLPSEHRTDVNQKCAFELLMSVDSVQTQMHAYIRHTAIS